MALGRKNDDVEAEGGEPGDQYATDIVMGTKGGTAKRLNKRWADGWRLVSAVQGGSTVLLIYERRT